MALSRVSGSDGHSLRTRNRRARFSFRVLAAIGLVGVLAAGCATPDATKAPTGSPAATPGESPAGTIVGAPGESPSYSAAPITPRRVDFEVDGDANNGWWWLRDGTGTQKVSSGFFGVPPANELKLDLTVLTTDTVAGRPGVDARFLLSYGAIVEGNVANAPGGEGGAYLISAFGDMINDEGVPSWWALAFIDKADADAVFRVEIDPWGKVTETEEVTGEGVISFVTEYTKRIPFEIIDSDEAVTLGKAALAARYNPVKTRDPRIALGFSRLTGGALYWTYMLFYESTAEYASAQIDALTGEVIPPT